MLSLRDLMPGIRDWNYFNYAAVGPLLKPSSDFLKRAAEEALAPFLYRENWLKEQEEARKSCADLISAEKEEIAFVSNTSSGLSLVANAIHWEKGDRILFPADEYPSNRFVWENLRQKGVQAEAIPVDPTVSFAQQLEKMNLKKVKLIAVSATSYFDGRKHDLEAIGKICRTNGILFSIDAIQALGASEVNVKKWDCDFLATGGRKWLFGPLGTGFLYIRKRLLNDLFVPIVGWASVKNPRDFEAKDWEFADSVKRFESSLLYVPAVIALGMSLETLKSFGWENIFKRTAALHNRLNQELSSMGYQVMRPQETSGILAISFADEEKATELAKRCVKKKILLTQRKSFIRLSVHAATQDREIDNVLEIFEMDH